MSAHNRGYKLTTEYHFSDTHAVRETDYFFAEDRQYAHEAFADRSAPPTNPAEQRAYTTDTGAIVVGTPRFSVYQACDWPDPWQEDTKECDDE